MLLLVLTQRFRAPDHEHLRPSEERRRREVGEGIGKAVARVVRPHRPPRAGSPLGHETPAQHPERSIDEEGLLAVQEVVGPERLALQGLQGVHGPGCAAARRARRAQKPSTACR